MVAAIDKFPPVDIIALFRIAFNRNLSNVVNYHKRPVVFFAYKRS